MSKGRKTNIELINDAVWHKKIYPKDYALSISNEKFVFTREFINVGGADQMIAAVSKSSDLPKNLILSHSSAKVLNECVDWLIKYCETFNRLVPPFQATKPKVFDRLEEYRLLQIKQNKKRRKKKRYT